MNMQRLETQLGEFLNTQWDGLTDHAHNIAHLKRVAYNSRKIMSSEGGDELVIITASYFHDIVSLPKSDPQRSSSSRLAADKAITLIRNNFPEIPDSLYENIHHTILAHSFSAKIQAKTIEAKILQDADRIDALGAVGLARVFYIAGSLGQNLFDDNDTFAVERPLNDKMFALDHFKTKLLKLANQMNTSEGYRIAAERSNYLLDFLDKLASELPQT